jgi:hypothetical protein
MTATTTTARPVPTQDELYAEYVTEAGNDGVDFAGYRRCRGLCDGAVTQHVAIQSLNWDTWTTRCRACDEES